MSQNNKELSIKDNDSEHVEAGSRGQMEYKAPLTQSEEYEVGEAETIGN